MKEFKDKVAIITGAANGFGLEFAKESAMRGMKAVLIDIEGDEVEAAKRLCEGMGMDCIAIKADVSLDSEVERCVSEVMEKYGQIDLLINNAGVGIGSTVWETPLNDWEWIFHINVMSQVYFMRLVIPIMMKQGTPCHILNVASAAGLFTGTDMPTYFASKHASVALTEAVYYDIQMTGANIKMSVFCPGYVQTDLYNSERHRPERYSDPSDPYYQSAAFTKSTTRAEYVVKNGMPIDSIGMSVYQALEDEIFYILTEPKFTGLIAGRVKNMLEGKVPNIKDFG